MKGCAFMCKSMNLNFCYEKLHCEFIGKSAEMKECAMILSIFYAHIHLYTLDDNHSWNVPSANPFGSPNESPNRIARYRHILNSLCKRFLIARPTILYASLRSAATRFYLQTPQLIKFAADIVRLTTQHLTYFSCSCRFSIRLLRALKSWIRLKNLAKSSWFLFSIFLKSFLLNIFQSEFCRYCIVGKEILINSKESEIFRVHTFFT